MRHGVQFVLPALAAAGLLIALLPGSQAGAPHGRPPDLELGSGDADQPVLTGNLDPLPRASAATWPIALSVVAEDGAPIEGAHLYFTERDATSIEHDGATVAVSAHNGIAFVSEPRGDAPVLVASARGFVPAQVPRDDLVRMAARARPRSATLPLRRGGRIHGVVLDSVGNPIAAARIHALGKRGTEVLVDGPGRLPGPRTAGSMQWAVSDGEGRFSIPGIAEFPVNVRASHAAAVHVLSGTVPTVRADGEFIEVRMQLLVYADMLARDAVTHEILNAVRWDVDDRPGHTMAVEGGVGVFDQEPTHHISGWRERGVYRQYFVATGDLRSNEHMPLVTATAPGYAPLQAVIERVFRVDEEESTDGERAGRVQVLDLDPESSSWEWGRVSIDVSLEGCDVAPRLLNIVLVQVTGRPRGGGKAAWHLRLAVTADSAHPDHGYAELRLPVGRYSAKISLSVGYPMAGEHVVEFEVTTKGESHLRLHGSLPRARILVEDRDGVRYHDFRVNVCRLSADPGAGPTNDSPPLLSPVVSLTKLGWDTFPNFHHARQLSEQGVHLGDMLLPAGRYALYVMQDNWEPVWQEFTLEPGAHTQTVRVVLQKHK